LDRIARQIELLASAIVKALRGISAIELITNEAS
jgi:hypothetical protein